MSKQTKTEHINLRVTPQMRAIVERAAANESRNASNWLERAMIERLLRLGYLERISD